MEKFQLLIERQVLSYRIRVKDVTRANDVIRISVYVARKHDESASECLRTYTSTSADVHMNVQNIAVFNNDIVIYFGCSLTCILMYRYK